MFDSSRKVVGKEMESHVPIQEQATTTNNNTGNAFRNMFLIMMAQLFDQFMGNEQEQQPQQLQHPPQPQPKVVHLAQHAPSMLAATPPKADHAQEILKRGIKEFLGDKVDDPHCS
ncbi:hypothetical protein J1N35_043705 [Gossypium stocksii]|uniref:Uncharacterized protein n=1 Tax=Gossypium stocksii TaxID=47602 RepID=A0A9D3U844_9ROSI|nr:hypothetical protein J1N35_043705 [Gossypium stocksii]